MELRILGSGTSTGVPEIGCTCPVCTSQDARDHRLRTSALVHVEDVTLLMDCGPDFRQQMLAASWFGRIDGVLMTHEHYDHTGGLDDLRPFCRAGEIPVYSDHHTAEHLRTCMPYCFGEHYYPGAPRIFLQEVQAGCPFTIRGVEVMPVKVMHGRLPILGFRIAGRLGYITDMSVLPDESFHLLQGLDVLVINALRVEPHVTHQTIAQAIEVSQRLAARETYFVHMSHGVGLHAELSRQLPPHIHLAYDGLRLSF